MRTHARLPARPGLRLPGICLLLWVVMQLTACTAQVVTQTSEYDANEIVSMLLSNGVSAQKHAVGEHSFDVWVPQDELQRALSLLVDAGLPREKRDTLGELFKREGMVSSATEEHIRYVQGLSKELERTLSEIDGIASARVHVVIPQPDLYAVERRPSSASVLIRYRKPADPAAFGPLVRSLVVRAVEGLAPEQVAIALIPIAPLGTGLPEYVSLFGLRMAPASYHDALAMVCVPWLLWSLTLLLLLRPQLLQRLRVPSARWGRGRAKQAAPAGSGGSGHTPGPGAPPREPALDESHAAGAQAPAPDKPAGMNSHAR